MQYLVRAFSAWLPLGVAITGLCLLAYATVQQQYRQSLNDPQIQMAEDGAAVLAGGGVPAQLVQRGIASIDIARSLAPWIAIYDASGTLLESSAALNGAPPTLPADVLDAAKNGLPPVVGHHFTNDIPQDENRVTWQPAPGVRQAIVVVYVPQRQQYVVAGRNMREVENREAQLATFVGIAWLALMIATFCAAWFSARVFR